MPGTIKSIKTKLASGFGLILVLVICLGVVAVYTINRISKVSDQIYTTNLVGVRTVASLNEYLNTIQSDLMGIEGAVAVYDTGKTKKLAKHIVAMRDQYNTVWERYYPAMTTTDEEKQVAEKLMVQHKAIIPKMDAYLKKIAGGSYMMAKNFYFSNVSADFLAQFDKLKKLSAFQAQSASQAYTTGAATAALSTRVIIGVLAGVVLLTLLITFVLTRMITRPLGQARRLVEAIADGRLDNRIETRTTDEFGQTLTALATMQEHLAGIVEKVRTSAESVTVGAGQISAGNDELSSRTQQQAASLQQTAASMEQMTSTVRQNAENAAKADQLAQDVNRQADEGGKIIGGAVMAMRNISEASGKITDIIGMIDDIAFQTNLLALNASVEAARAGEQGRGFAVVASEVRNLAGRSASAAKDIKALVEDSADKVKAGSEQVELSGRTLDEIIAAVSQVSSIISEIATASSEQSGGIEQVNLAVSEMDNMTQQNASLVEQSAAASRSLETQAQTLRREVEFFRLEEESAALLPSN